MFLRFLGRIFLYFVIFPFLARYVGPMFLNMAQDLIESEYEKMTPTQKKRFERNYPSINKTRTKSRLKAYIPLQGV